MKLSAVTITTAFFFVPPAAAHACTGNSWATGAWGWNNNYWVGYNTSGTASCDLFGRYTAGVQRINWDQGYRQSGVDGYYGANTHQDVRSFQAFYGLTVDGLVGPGTWGQYRSRITIVDTDGGMQRYRTTSSGPGGSIRFGYDTVANRWYVAWAGWKRFDTGGP